MITKKEVVDGLQNGTIRLELSQWGDGMRGVGLYRRGEMRPIERIAEPAWHVDQHDGLQYADLDQYPTWAYYIFGAYALSRQARAMLAAYCAAHEEAILAWCDGDQTATLPLFVAATLPPG